MLFKKNAELSFILFSAFFGNQVFSEEVSTQAANLREVLSPLGNNVVGKSIPEIIIDEPYKYIAGKPGKYIYQPIYKDSEGVDVRFEIHSDFDGKLHELRKWSLKIDDNFIEEWQADSEGNVHLVAQTDVDSGYRVVLKPHLVLPIGARQGQRWKNESSLYVYDISDPDTIVYEGTLLSNKVYEGCFEVITPDGKFDSILISDDYKINIGAVTIKDKRYTFYAYNVGKIAEIDGFHVSAFLFYHKQRNEVKVLRTLPRTTDK